MVKHTDHTNSEEAEFSEKIDSIGIDHPRHLITLKLFASKLQQRSEPLDREQRAEGTRDRAAYFATDVHTKKACRAIDFKHYAPIVFLERTQVGPKQEPIGSYATMPAEIDSICRSAWGQIYRGVVKCSTTLVLYFLEAYLPYIIAQEEYKLEDIIPSNSWSIVYIPQSPPEASTAGKPKICTCWIIRRTTG